MEARRLVLTLTGIAVALIVVIGGLTVVLVATGGDDDNGNGGGDGLDLGERIAGELRLFGPDPITLDPACASDASSAQYIVEIFSGLLTFDRDLNLIPDIAAEMPQVSDDGTTYTFTLSSDVIFHDNSRPVTADDFKYSMERALNPDTQSTVGEVYLDDIVGAEEFAEGDADEVAGIQVIDPQTLEITIGEPSKVFLDKLTYPTAFVVDQREVGDSTCFEGNWTLNPNGTGPFRLEQWDLGRSIILEPNERYHLDPAPSLDRVTYLLSGGNSFVMYENDEVDITGIGINNIESVRDTNNDLNADLQETPSLDVYYVGFNAQSEPFDDPLVRRALSLSIDREFLADEFLIDLVEPAYGVLPPGIPGYNQDIAEIPFDPDQARDLLDQAGGPGILEDATILTSGQGATPSDVLQAVVAMWEQELGVVVTIEQEEFGLFLRDIDEGNFEMFSLGWIADYPDPQNFLEIKLHSESANNESGYANQDVDALLDEASQEEDDEARLELYRQAEELIMEDMPWAPLYHGKNTYLVKPYVEGFEIPPFVIPNLRYVSVNR